MAQMGQRVERERPRLSPALVERMLSFMIDAPDGGPPLQMLRPMLFRSVAVVVGLPAQPVLQRCVTQVARLRGLCQDTMTEISTAKS